MSLFLWILSACQSHNGSAPVYTDRERLQLDTTDNHTTNIDSLMDFVRLYREVGDREREMAALAALGHSFQTSSRYAEAVKTHQQQLTLAESLGDSLMVASALNDLGVNYRRLGLHYDALDYHLRAVEKTQEPEMEHNTKMLKCQAIGYNGVGNVYLSIGSYLKADEMLRKALAIEDRLGSHLGMNVDLANIGLVFMHRDMIDSAWLYFRRSMHHSKLAGSVTGQAYGHMNYGKLYAREGDYQRAAEEYRRSMSLVHHDRDLWLWLQPCIALAGAYVESAMIDSAHTQLSLALRTAQQIEAKEYIPQIYRIYASLYEKQSNHRKALEAYRMAEASEDSLLNARHLFEIETLQNEIDSRRQAYIDAALQRERGVKYIFLLGFLVFLMLCVLLYSTLRVRRRSLHALKKMSQVREAFFTNVTHELRTPLTVILGLSEDLKTDHSNTATTQEKAQTIWKHGNSLLALINQLLDISRIKSAVGAADWRSGNVSSYIGMIIESYRDYAVSRHIDLTYLSREDVEMDFVPDYVNKIFNNLLSNAFKFTPEYGKVSILLWREGEQLYVDVSDTGTGIPVASLDHIFEAFYQVDQNSRHIGTGVGLALVKQLVEIAHGSISVESTEGRGTTFHIRVPIRREHTAFLQVSEPELRNKPQLPPLQDAPTDDSDTGSARLLIIEDNHDIAKLIGTQLLSQYTVFYASDGILGHSKAMELVPDLIITDRMLPRMDGLEICRELKRNDITNHIPIIVISAKASDLERIKGFEAGADAYLTKPFNGDELRMLVGQLLNGRRILREKFAKAMVACKEECPSGTAKSAKSDADARFLAKVADTVCLRISRQEDTDVATLSSKMCMSTSQFYRKITALTGYTPNAYIQRIKIKKAQHLLETKPEMSLSEVAELSGFNDYSNFVRAFKNVLEVTPSEYRRTSFLA